MEKVYNETDYIFALPFSVRKELCNILDPLNTWEKLASLMPDMKISDVEACRIAQSPISPTEVLLLIWGSKGNTVIQLYNYLARLKNVRAMIVIRHLVDPGFHHWEKQCLTQQEKNEESTSGSNKLLDLTSSSHDEHLEAGNFRFDLTDDMVRDLQSTVSVKYSELLSITDNFSSKNFIGRGGYGIVYKAKWKNIQVAVKRICSSEDPMNQDFKKEKRKTLQSLQELRILNKYRHDNIIPLYGYSFDGPTFILIYQFMENKSLEDCLQLKSRSIPLSWPQRMNIYTGIASALHYLHTVSLIPVIHGDVKSANILIDRSLKPKLGDFALCKLEEVSVPEIQSARREFYGTYAYLSPEFLSKKIISTKLDVFAFGVVLLELSSGLRAYYTEKRQRLAEFSRGVFLLFEDNRTEISKIMMDPKCPSNNESDFKQFCTMFELGIECIEEDPVKRPSFADILAY